jgi:hypothetical protein
MWFAPPWRFICVGSQAENNGGLERWLEISLLSVHLTRKVNMESPLTRTEALGAIPTFKQ